MVETFDKIHERKLFERYEPTIKCPKCKSEDILIYMESNKYFWISKCNKCGYKK